MSANNLKIDDQVSEQQSMNRFKGASKRQHPMLDFFTDFLTGFGALFLIGVILFIVIPLLLFVLKVGLALIVPVAALGACIILIALFGKFIKSLIKR